MLKYGKKIKRFNPESLDRLNIDRQSIALVPEKSRVLEIGCATGFMGEYLIRQKKCEVVGVEKGKDEANLAKPVLSKVINGDIEKEDILKIIEKEGKFDVIFASALIEHLVDPLVALGKWSKFLKPNGFLVLTTSNIAHWSARIKILLGDFSYKDYGLFDNTHLRFFTIGSFKKLVEDAGYEIECFFIDSVGGGYPRASKFLSRFFPGLFAYQMLIKAKMKF